MKCKIKNNSNLNMDKFMPLLNSFLPYAQKNMGFHKPPSLFFTSDAENAEKPLGKTGFYDPDALSITIFVDKRHPKDIMRSLSHELVHHTQCCRGDFNGDLVGAAGGGYAQKGNLTFRDWEDTHKKQLQESIYYTTGEKAKMSYKNWRNEESNTLLMEKWGYVKEGKGHAGKSCKEAHGDSSHEEWEGEQEQVDEGCGEMPMAHAEAPKKKKRVAIIQLQEEDEFGMDMSDTPDMSTPDVPSMDDINNDVEQEMEKMDRNTMTEEEFDEFGPGVSRGPAVGLSEKRRRQTRAGKSTEEQLLRKVVREALRRSLRQ